MSAAPKQTEAQRLAGELMESHRGHSDEGPSTFSGAAALLLRQDELLAQAEKALKTVAKELGIDWLRDEFFDANETMLAIRSHRDEK